VKTPLAIATAANACRVVGTESVERAPKGLQPNGEQTPMASAGLRLNC